jgi:hypothetical protein
MTTVFNQTVFEYLRTYLKTATNGNVEVQSGMFGKNHFVRFFCKKCKDNWNVGAHLFTGCGVPDELTHWAPLHRHETDAALPMTGIRPCIGCGKLGVVLCLECQEKLKLINKTQAPREETGRRFRREGE